MSRGYKKDKLKWVGWGSLAIAMLLAALMTANQHGHQESAKAQAREQNLLKMASTKEHAEEYVGGIFRLLRAISLDSNIRKLGGGSHESIQLLFDEYYDQHQLAELYIIEKDFDGTQAPFETFEHGNEELEADELHCLAREKDEYEAQMEQIGWFAENPSLKALISEPLDLCTGEVGLVLSVPIRADDGLVGIVAGMVPITRIAQELGRGNYENTVFLTNDRADCFCCDGCPSETVAHFQELLHPKEEASFLAELRNDSQYRGYEVLRTSVDMPGEQAWHMIFMYNEAAYAQPGGVLARWIGWATAGIILLLGLATMALCRISSHRLATEETLKSVVEGTSETTGAAFFQTLARHMAGALGLKYALVAEIVGGDLSQARTLAVWAGDKFAENFTYDLAGTPCRRVTDSGTCKFPRGVQKSFPKDVLLVEMGVESYMGAPLRDSVGNVVGILALMDDRPMNLTSLSESLLEIFSVRAAAELERMRTLVDLVQEKRTSETARIAAEAANRAKSEFLANTSHELRTPLTAILGFADVLLERDNIEYEPPEKIEAARTIKRNGDHLLGIINDILDLSKIEAGKMTVERIVCSPCRLIAEAVSMARVAADAKGLLVEVEYVGDIPQTMRSDPTRLRQILLNVLANAVKFTEVGSVRTLVRLVTDGDEPLMRFDVVDSGVGMTKDQVAGLFTPFVQADNSTTRRFGGTGLGLAIAKRLARMLGGNVEVVETKVGAGTRVRITIATGSLDGVELVKDPTSLVPVEDKPTEAPSKPDSLELSGCRILLAEDGLDNQRLIGHILRKAGADVTIVENGKLAIGVALGPGIDADGMGAYDAILMDMQMPVMGGYEATSILRSRGFNGPIIALTANAMSGDREKCINAGCSDYASKPINRKELIATIRDAIDRDRLKPRTELAAHASALET